MKIITNFVHPPIPIRNFDWEAYVDGSIDVCQDPECGCRRKVKVGRGPTEAAAVQDLMEQYQQD